MKLVRAGRRNCWMNKIVNPLATSRRTAPITIIIVGVRNRSATTGVVVACIVVVVFGGSGSDSVVRSRAFTFNPPTTSASFPTFSCSRGTAAVELPGGVATGLTTATGVDGFPITADGTTGGGAGDAAMVGAALTFCTGGVCGIDGVTGFESAYVFVGSTVAD